jgi:CheY-like chemotaxis protein
VGDDNGLAGRHILVVEDNFLLAMEIERVLRREGCVVLGPVGSVDQALALLEEAARPDLAVLDVDLQGRRVTPVAAWLRSREIPFVLVTGYADLHLGEPDLLGGPRLEKPVDGLTLMATLRRMLAA